MTTYNAKEKRFYERNKLQRSLYYKKYYLEKTKHLEKKKIKLVKSELEFRTKHDLKLFVHKTCLSILDETVNENHKCFNLFLDLINRHPNKEKLNTTIFKIISVGSKYRSYYWNMNENRWRIFSILKTK
jgi:hypothetical protein